jgi:effector-binding domain-containing protein
MRTVKVSVLTVDARPTAVIPETTSWEAYPEVWPRLLEVVWSTVRPRQDEIGPGRNVMLYKDDVPNVEVGVEVSGSFARAGRIVASALPAGRVATATHRGSWDVAPAHRAVIEECDRLGLERVGPRWEIYGHFNAPGDEEVEIYYLVR